MTPQNKHANPQKHYLELLHKMTEKEIKVRYKRTVFGTLWILINPILQMIVIGTIFSFFIKQPIEYYYIFLFIGLLMWGFFSQSLMRATPCLFFERNLIKKAKFPYEVIPLSIIYSHLFHMVVALVAIVLPISFILGTFSIVSLFTILYSLLLLVAFTTGIGLITSSLNVRFRDINFFTQAILLIWFYATPIIYPIAFIPSNYAWAWSFNPLTAIVELMRFSFLDTNMPSMTSVTISSLVTCASVFIGWNVFRTLGKTFDDWL